MEFDEGFDPYELPPPPVRRRPGQNSRSRALPVMPIRDMVYYPGMVFPLFLGRDKTVRAMDAAMDKNRLVLLLAQRDPDVEDPEPSDLYDVGVIAEIIQQLHIPDGTVRLTLEALERAKVVRYKQLEPFLSAHVQPLVEYHTATIQAEALKRSVMSDFEQMVQSQMGSGGRMIPPEVLINVSSIDEPGKLADAVSPHIPGKLDTKQDLLETVNVEDRLSKLHTALLKEIEVIDVQREIRGRVEREMGDNQREYILREQLRTIQEELGAVEEESEEGEYRKKIAESGMPEEVQEKAYKELDRLTRMPFASPEGSVIRTYLDWLVSMPWNILTDDTIDIDEARKVLDADHYGLDKVKERIVEFLAVRKLSPESRGPILCFVGPPGVGKTSIGKSIAKCMGRKFHRISLGGIRDEAEIRGHRRTYIGSLPGRIVQGIKSAGVRNPVFMLDEIDKLGADFRGDPSSALLEALDPEQNKAFSDHYLEAPFDLSNVMFITTANVLDTIPHALRDRMEVIAYPGYIEHEKLQIAKRHLVPKQLKEHGLNSKILKFNDSGLRTIVREYTREAGVRNLEREIAAVCRKVATEVARGKDVHVSVTDKDVTTYLGQKKFHYGLAQEKDQVAISTGLAYTEFGGDIISVESMVMKTDKGRLNMTGQLGDVMKESGQAALTYLRSRCEMLGLDPDFYDHSDVHVHVPEGGVPKDGPSAGVTIAVSLASALTGRPVRSDIAMTGEITLTGRILPVGGIKEKMLAAHRAGIRIIMLPKRNESDLEDIPEDVRKEMTFHLIDHADEALELALRSA